MTNLGRAAGVAAIGTFTVNSCLYNVDGGQRAVMFDSLRGGIRNDVRGEGTHFIVSGALHCIHIVSKQNGLYQEMCDECCDLPVSEQHKIGRASCRERV